MRTKPIFKNGNSMIWLILAVVVVLVVIGGFYWLMNRTDTNKKTAVPVETTKPISSSSSDFEDLEKEVAAEDVDNNPAQVEEDFSALDKDIESL